MTDVVFILNVARESFSDKNHLCPVYHYPFLSQISLMRTLQERTILLTITGSHAHGTANETSDIDVMGTAVPTRRQIHSVFQHFDQENQAEKLQPFAADLPQAEQAIVAHSKLEGTVYGIQKFLHLASMANPNILEVLFCRESEIRRITPLGELLRGERDLFVTAKCRHTFGGYASNQLGRLRRHYRWHTDGPTGPPDRADYDLPTMARISKADVDAAEAAVQTQLDRWELDLQEVEPAVRIDVENRIANTLTEWKLSADQDKWNAAARWIGLDDNLIEMIQQERRWRLANQEWQKYRGWLENRNPDRAKLEAEYGYDTKHGAHLVRLLRMGLEIITTGHVHVWRGDRDADELRAIRDGAWSYETLCDWADQAYVELEKQTTELPVHTDRGKVDALSMQIITAGLNQQD